MIDRAITPVAARYTRSIHLERDFTEAGLGIDGYQITPLVVQTIERITSGLNASSTARAYSLIGPYGAGKSAFGVFLAHYLGKSASERSAIVSQYSGSGIVSIDDTQNLTLLPILVGGNNSSLRLAIAKAIRHTIDSIGNIHQIALVNTIKNTIDSEHIDPQSLADVVSTLSHLVRDHTHFAGIALIIDELGQYLNYTARHGDERDLFVLQSLAEMAARSGDTPCLIVTLLHQTFDRYATTAGMTQRLEWTKVQGRFIEIPFQESTSQLIRMLGHALCSVENIDVPRWKWGRRMAILADRVGLRPNDISLVDWEQIVAQTYPLHPSVVAALPLLLRQLAQNERSLFAFLNSPEPGGLQEFLTTTGNDSTIYRLPHLYEYIEATLGANLFARARGQRWAELAESRLSIETQEQIISDTLTSIGMINAFGHNRGLHANTEQITFALSDVLNDSTIDESINWLIKHQHIIYRKHRNSFMLWEGSDIDLDSLIQNSRREIIEKVSLVDLLNTYAIQAPFVARHFSYETGTIRAFFTHFVDIHELEQSPMKSSSYDGEVALFVPANDEELFIAKSWATHEDRIKTPNLIIVLPQQVSFLRNVLLDVATLQHVIATTNELEHDRVARRELSSRLVEAQQLVDEAIEKTYRPSRSDWFWVGQQRFIKTARTLDRLLSEVCHTVYPATPRIWNELIVRQNISTAAAKARRNLIEAMILHGHEENLGMTGFPPERSIYESVFRRSGIHYRNDDDVWKFAGPPPNDPLLLQPVWNEINTFFSRTELQPLPLEELYSLLTSPPYGIRGGLLPLFFVAAYLANAGEIIIYEHGNFIPEPDMALFERLIRQPRYITVRRSRTTGARMDVYTRLVRALVPTALNNPKPALLDAVTPLLRFVHRLPAYTRQTQTISSQAQSVRYALLNAPSPDDLLFSQLPQACGLPSFTVDQPADASVIEQFFSTLNLVFDELKTTYFVLLEYILSSIKTAFRTSADDNSTVREELIQRFAITNDVITDTDVRAVGIRLQTANEGNGWLESIAALVGKKSPETWSDDDTALFGVRIADIGHRFRVIEQIAIASQTFTSEAKVLRVGIADTQGERSIVVSTAHYSDKMQKLSNELSNILLQYDILSATQQTTVLAMILQQIMKE